MYYREAFRLLYICICRLKYRQGIDQQKWKLDSKLPHFSQLLLKISIMWRSLFRWLWPFITYVTRLRFSLLRDKGTVVGYAISGLFSSIKWLSLPSDVHLVMRCFNDWWETDMQGSRSRPSKTVSKPHSAKCISVLITLNTNMWFIICPGTHTRVTWYSIKFQSIGR